MRISEVMTANIEYTEPNATLQQAAAQMKSCQVGSLPVFDGNKLVGIVTDRDITVRGTAEGMDPWLGRIANVMTEDVTCCYEDHLVIDAALLMQENQLRRLVVLGRDDKPVGIVSLGDLAVQAHDEQLVENTLEEVCATR